MWFRRWVLIAPLLALAFLVPVAAPSAAHADQFGLPDSPTNVQATTTPSGIKVTWKPSPASSPAITHYVVHAGPGSCPVTVPASATTATMPFIKGQKSVRPQVQAVSDYGFSPDASANAVMVPTNATPGFRNVQLLEFSDLHGAIESSNSSIGAPVLASAFARDRGTVKSTFVVSAGDNIGGAPVISSQFEERPTIEALNLMGLDVTTLGNHEHDRPLEHVRSMIDLSEFPWVASDYKSISPLEGSRNRVLPFTVLNRGGVKVGFIGLNTADLALRTSPDNLRYGPLRSITIDDSTARIQRSVKAARAEGAQLIVALVHRGWDANEGGRARGPLIDTARALKGVDVVFGGDSHLQYASVLGNKTVVQVPNSGQMYSRVVVCLDTKANRPIGASVGFVTKADVANLAPSGPVTNLVSRYQTALAGKLDVRVGVIDGVFPRGGNPPVERSQETPMGDLAADALRTKYATDFAIINGGGIRDTLPASGYRPQDTSLRRPSAASTGPYDVTLGDMVSVFPFNDYVATTTVTGANLWRALENGVSKWPSEGRFPQVSGLNFTFDPSRPVGSRLLTVTRDDGTPLAADDTTYSIAVPAFMVSGGDGYSDVFGRDAVVREPLLDVVLEPLRRDLASGVVTVVPTTGKRITIMR